MDIVIERNGQRFKLIPFRESREYDIHKIKRDKDHKYEYCDGILYRLGYHNNDFTLGIDQIEATPENSFYEDQIERYMSYIKNGGIIDTFPVSGSALAYNLGDMASFLDELNIHDTLDADADATVFIDSFSKEYQYSLYDIIFEDDNINEHARSIEQVFINPPSDAEQQFIPLFNRIFKFFNEHREWTLTDMNHRFEAVKRLGVSSILCEPV